MPWNWWRGKRSSSECVATGRCPLALALEVTEQIARALVAAEKCGVVHRDLKPSNIMLESEAGDALLVKVIDYGIAKVLAPEAESGLEKTHAGFIGTPAFASPEQFAGGSIAVDTRSDIYSLGVTLWYLLCGKTPFVGRTMEEIRGRQKEDLPMEQVKHLHLPYSGYHLAQVDVGSGPEGQTAVCARSARYAPPLLCKI